MPRVIHFEIIVEKIDRAINFYKKTFGWEIEKWGGPQDYWLIKTGDESEPGINGGMSLRKKQFEPDRNTAFVCTIDVPSLDMYVAKILENGGIAETPKMAVPGTGYLAYCKDTEGNTFGIMQLDESVE